MSLTLEQQQQIERQIAAHHHQKYEVDIELRPGEALEQFAVHRNVFRPELTTSKSLAQFIAAHKDLVDQKSVIDMGSGSGIQGVAMGRCGASAIYFSDISSAAVENSLDNVRKFGLSEKSTVVQGNLFESVKDKADLIVFNHPFFPDEPIEGEPVSSAMLDPGVLIHRFLEEAKRYCRGSIIMPFLHLAGQVNDPGVQAPKHGFSIVDKSTFEVNSDLQRGLFSIYELRFPGNGTQG
jgi:methylase of polypeptide subunit release factors